MAEILFIVDEAEPALLTQFGADMAEILASRPSDREFSGLNFGWLTIVFGDGVLEDFKFGGMPPTFKVEGDNGGRLEFLTPLPGPLSFLLGSCSLTLRGVFGVLMLAWVRKKLASG